MDGFGVMGLLGTIQMEHVIKERSSVRVLALLFFFFETEVDKPNTENRTGRFDTGWLFHDCHVTASRLSFHFINKNMIKKV